jgi:ABC-type antimicrobial peptide transport system permease subunit
MNSLFGPLGKQYCMLFYFLSIFGLISIILGVFLTIYIGIVEKKKASFYLAAIPMIILYGFMYLQNRILFQICSNSL